jgi:hypothetical protein
VVMATHVGRVKRLLMVAFILGAASAAPVAKSQSSKDQTTPEIVLPNSTSPSGLTGDEVIA